ncbi:MAG: Os1348 family NHLP clan protein [Planctomycetaceae bacterium]|nr:Os1348 family NHLP clan protein [Planctomycetaceae bacterium]
MSINADHNPSGRAQLRADVPGEQQPLEQQQHEQEAVRTTIVGGRPPGSGKPMGNVPRGIEVLLKKAAIDAEFRELLLGDPEAAAESIALELTPVEQAMLQNIPAEQLSAIIHQTQVPQQQRRAFLGTAAAAMLAVLTGTVIGCPDGCIPPIPLIGPQGIRPDDPRWSVPFVTSDESLDEGGVSPDMPEIPPGAASMGIQPDMLANPVIENHPDRWPPAPGGVSPDFPQQMEMQWQMMREMRQQSPPPGIAGIVPDMPIQEE